MTIDLIDAFWIGLAGYLLVRAIFSLFPKDPPK
jgi:hypothetical protein